MLLRQFITLTALVNRIGKSPFRIQSLGIWKRRMNKSNECHVVFVLNCNTHQAI